MNQVQKVNTLAIIGAIILAVILSVQHYIKNDSSATSTLATSTNLLSAQKVSNPKTFSTSKQEIWHGDTSKQQVIFTFDGGDASTSGDKILEILKKHNVKGTFFLTGKFVENNPDLVKRMLQMGNEVFNHTYDHPHLPSLSDENIILELDKMDNTLVRLTGSTTRPYFRAPFGDRNSQVLAVAAQDGFQSIYWTIDALDWEESTGMTADKVTEKILTNIKPGNIFLMHIGDTITGSILDNVFTSIEQKGYKIVSLSEGL